jgi:hypothetical protein
MTLRDTELIGKKLVKYGFYRNTRNHHIYGHGDITLQFKMLYTNFWYADIELTIYMDTIVRFKGQQAVFTPEWLVEEYDKIKAMFKFLRS